MSSFYDDASLVVIPSGYKTSKVYAEKPTDGSGDLAFTRTGDTATRVNSAGIIEKVRTNLILQSNTFSTTWTTTTATVASGQAGYDGSTNAWLLTKSAASGRINQSFSAPSELTTFSVYAKANASSYIAIEFSTSYIYVNLTNGAQGSSGAGTYKVDSIGNGWYRISMTTGIVSSVFRIYPAENNDLSATTGSIFIQNAQVETGDIATAYIPTTTAAVSVGPVANVPRLDYLGSTCPRLLLEPQRTNSALYSEQINNAAWGKLNVTVSANQAVGPDGTTSADLVYPTTTGADRVIEQLPVAVIGQTWTSSFFVKASGFSWVLMYAPNLGACWFNASTGVFGTIAAGVTATVLGQVNGYWRISLTGTVASSNAYLYVGPADANGTSTATANGTNGILLWGCQLEQGAYATSYIPTLASASTRSADACSKTGISSLIGQTEGVLFVDYNYEAKPDASGNIPIVIVSGSNEAYIYITNAGALRFELYNAGALQALITGTIGAAGRKKIAFAYKANDFVGYLNGVQVGTDTSGTVGAMAAVHVGAYYTSNYSSVSGINEALLFKTRLTNAALAELTTL